MPNNITMQSLNRMSWDDYIALRARTKEVPCPTCGAKPGEACCFLPGLARVMASPHFERFRMLVL